MSGGHFPFPLQVFDLLSDVGGAFGLYLGLSVVALFEFIELGMDLLGVLCKTIHKSITRSAELKK